MESQKSKKYIRRLAGRAYKSNVQRNMLIIMAIVLTTFMITTVFSMGISYWESIQQRTVMMEGIKYDVALPEPTEDQVKSVAEHSLVDIAGVAVKCAIVEQYDGQSTHIRLYWADEANWKKQCIPAFEIIEGDYPSGYEDRKSVV